jgi:hypothetical protein
MDNEIHVIVGKQRAGMSTTAWEITLLLKKELEDNPMLREALKHNLTPSFLKKIKTIIKNKKRDTPV